MLVALKRQGAKIDTIFQTLNELPGAPIKNNKAIWQQVYHLKTAGVDWAPLEDGGADSDQTQNYVSANVRPRVEVAGLEKQMAAGETVEDDRVIITRRNVLPVWTEARKALLDEMRSQSKNFSVIFEAVNKLPGPLVLSVDAVRTQWHKQNSRNAAGVIKPPAAEPRDPEKLDMSVARKLILDEEKFLGVAHICLNDALQWALNNQIDIYKLDDAAVVKAANALRKEFCLPPFVIIPARGKPERLPPPCFGGGNDDDHKKPQFARRVDA